VLADDVTHAHASRCLAIELVAQGDGLEVFLMTALGVEV